MRETLSIFFTILSFGLLFGQSSDTTTNTTNLPIDVICYNLEVQIIPNQKQIKGKAILHAKSLERVSGVFFELDNAIKLESVLIHKRRSTWDSATYTRMSDKISVVLPKSVKKDKEVFIQLNFSGDFKKDDDSKFNWNTVNNWDPFLKKNSENTPFYWWPCIADQKPDSMDFSLIIPKELNCLTLGELKEEEIFNDAFKTFKWMINFPVKTPNIPIFIGNYKKTEKTYQSISGKNVLVEIWSPLKNNNNAQPLMRNVFEELSYFEKSIAPFPRKNLKVVAANTSKNYNYPSLVYHSTESNATMATQWFHPYFLSDKKSEEENESFLNAISRYCHLLYEDSIGKNALTKNIKLLHHKLNVQLAYQPPYQPATIEKFYTTSLHTINYYLSKQQLYPLFSKIHQLLENNKWITSEHPNYKNVLFDLTNQPSLARLGNIPSHPDSIPQLGVFFSDGSLKLTWKKPKDYLLQKPVEITISEEQRQVNMPENRGEIPIKRGQNFIIDPNHWFFMKKPEYKLGEMHPGKYTLQDYYSDNPWLHSHTEHVLLTLTDTQRVAQMIITSGGKHGKTNTVVKKLIEQQQVGGVIFLKGDKQAFKSFISQLDSINLSKKGLPLIYSMDAEPSLIKGRLTGFPETVKTIEIKDTIQCQLIANQIDSALLEIGVRHNFAPVCDRSASNAAISNRSFGTDPERVKTMAMSYIKATQKDQIIATAKHFPGHGLVKGDTHKQSVYIDGEMKELDVYEPLIKGGVISIMIAHIVVKNNPIYDTGGLPSSCSKRIITDLLKEEMGFEGLAVTDALNIMKAVTIIEKAPLKASMAGCDFILMPQNEGEVIEDVLNEMNRNPHYKQRVYESVKKIIRAKICLGFL